MTQSTASSTPPDPVPASAARRGVPRLLAQAIGFILGLGLLWWCIAEALKDEHREQLAQLTKATTWQIAAMVLLTLATLTLNGTLFWVTLRPVRRLRWPDLVAVNIVASLLALLPFKLSVLFRILIHRGRDKIPLLTIGAWFSAMAVIMLAVIAPVAAVAAWAAAAAAAQTESTAAAGSAGAAIPRWWPALAIAGAALAGLGIITTSRFFASEARWATLQRLAELIPSGRLRQAATATLLPRAHEGMRMLAAPGHVSAAVALRLADIAAQTARFLLAAAIIGQPLSLELAVLAASAYFMIGAVAPTGALGVREAGTAGVFALLATEGFFITVLMITAVETLVLLAAAALAIVYLRPDRIIRASPARRADRQ